jgi:hypothetical protein
MSSSPLASERATAAAPAGQPQAMRRGRIDQHRLLVQHPDV